MVTAVVYRVFNISIKYWGLRCITKLTSRVLECIKILRKKDATNKKVAFFFLKEGPLFNLAAIRPRERVTTGLLELSESKGKNLPLLKFKTTEVLLAFFTLGTLLGSSRWPIKKNARCGKALCLGNAKCFWLR